MAKTLVELLAEQEAKINSQVNEQLSITEQNNQKLESIMEQMHLITKKAVYEDYNWKAGKVIGILRHIRQNPKQRKELLSLTGLNESILDLYNSSCGQLPYVNKDGNYVEGYAPDIETFRNVILIAATRLGVLVFDDQLNDINMSKWNRLYARAEETAEKTRGMFTGTKFDYDE